MDLELPRLSSISKEEDFLNVLKQELEELLEQEKEVKKIYKKYIELELAEKEDLKKQNFKVKFLKKIKKLLEWEEYNDINISEEDYNIVHNLLSKEDFKLLKQISKDSNTKEEFFTKIDNLTFSKVKELKEIIESQQKLIIEISQKISNTISCNMENI